MTPSGSDNRAKEAEEAEEDNKKSCPSVTTSYTKLGSSEFGESDRLTEFSQESEEEKQEETKCHSTKPKLCTLPSSSNEYQSSEKQALRNKIQNKNLLNNQLHQVCHLILMHNNLIKTYLLQQKCLYKIFIGLFLCF